MQIEGEESQYEMISLLSFNNEDNSFEIINYTDAWKGLAGGDEIKNLDHQDLMNYMRSGMLFTISNFKFYRFYPATSHACIQNHKQHKSRF